MRDSEAPYRISSDVIDAWVDGRDPKPVIARAPDHLRDLVRYSARCQCDLVKYWVVKGVHMAPRNLQPLVERYLERKIR